MALMSLNDDSIDLAPLISQNAISFDPLQSNGESQTINWTYDPLVADLDWLQSGDTSLTFTAQVNDSHGVQGSRSLILTITGANDAPVITASNDNITGSITVHHSLIPAPSPLLIPISAIDPPPQKTPSPSPLCALMASLSWS